jgi:peptidyl-prolyl cis-trans isomerase D
MLETIRNFTKGPVAVALLSLLIISFGAWGIGDILRVHGEPPVARVADQTVSANDLQLAFQQRVDQIREQGYKTFDAEQARMMGLDRQILDELIQLRAFDQAGHDLGLGVPDALIVKEIEENPNLRTGNQFDRPKFEAWLREHNLTEDRYVTMMRSLLMEQSMLTALGGGLNVPRAIAMPLIAYQAERRTVRYVVLPPEAAGTLPPIGDAEIAKVYNENKESFLAPEYRRITFVDINPAEIAKTIQVSEDDIKARYEQHKADYALPEKRKLEQLIFQDQAKAQAAADAIKSGKTFTAVAAAEGKTPADIDLGEKTKAAMEPKLADPVFAAADGGIAGPIEGDFGWSLVHVVKIIPAAQKTLVDMRDQIAKDIAKDKASNEAFQRGHKLEDAREGGATLEAAAKAVGLTTITVDAVDHEGKDPKGGPVAALAGKAAILADAFKAQAGEEPDIQQTPEGGSYVVRLDSTTPPAQKPLTAVSDEIRKSLETEKRMAALKDKAKALAARGAAGESLDALGTSMGRAPLKSDPLTRRAESELFSPEALTDIFSAPQGGFLSAPVQQGESVLIAQIATIEKPSDAEIDATYRRELMERQGMKVLGNEIASQYAGALVSRYKVKINEEALKRASGGA